MTLLDMVREHGKVEVTMKEEGSGYAVVAAGRGGMQMEYKLSDVKFAVGGGCTVAQPLVGQE